MEIPEFSPFPVCGGKRRIIAIPCKTCRNPSGDSYWEGGHPRGYCSLSDRYSCTFIHLPMFFFGTPRGFWKMPLLVRCDQPPDKTCGSLIHQENSYIAKGPTSEWNKMRWNDVKRTQSFHGSCERNDCLYQKTSNLWVKKIILFVWRTFFK